MSQAVQALPGYASLPSPAPRLTGDASCRGSHLPPQTRSALPDPGSHGSSPPRQPHLPHRAGRPAGTQPGTPPGLSGRHLRSGAAPDPPGWLGPASGPGCRWGQEGIEHKEAGPCISSPLVTSPSSGLDLLPTSIPPRMDRQTRLGIGGK